MEPSCLSLCVGIIGIGMSYHHVAEHPAAVDGNANAEGIATCAEHRLEVSG